jgi:F0F1-type ATP synthase assembly protein I
MMRRILLIAFSALIVGLIAYLVREVAYPSVGAVLGPLTYWHVALAAGCGALIATTRELRP